MAISLVLSLIILCLVFIAFLYTFYLYKKQQKVSSEEIIKETTMIGYTVSDLAEEIKIFSLNREKQYQRELSNKDSYNPSEFIKHFAFERSKIDLRSTIYMPHASIQYVYAKPFFEEMKTQGWQINELFTHHVSPSSKMIIYSLIKNGHEFFTGISIKTAPLSEHYTFTNALPEYSDDKVNYAMINSDILEIYGKSNEFSSVKLDEIQFIFNTFAAKGERKKVNSDKIISIYQPTFNSYTRTYAFERIPVNSLKQSYYDADLNLSYERFDLNLLNERVKVAPKLMFKYIQGALKAGKNCFLYGPAGCGKTTFSNLVISELAKDDDTKIVLLDSNIAPKLSDPQFVSALFRFIPRPELEYENTKDITNISSSKKDKKTPNQRVIFIVEDGDALIDNLMPNGVKAVHASTILSMLDGTSKLLYNATFLFNSNSNVPNNEIIERRFPVVVPFSLLSIESAIAKATDVKNNIPLNSGIYFDEDSFTRLLVEAREKKKGIMLSSIYNCLIQPEEEDILIQIQQDILNEAKKNNPDMSEDTVPIKSSLGFKPRTEKTEEEIKNGELNKIIKEALFDETVYTKLTDIVEEKMFKRKQEDLKLKFPLKVNKHY